MGNGKSSTHGISHTAARLIEGILALALLIFMVWIRIRYPANAYPWQITSDTEYELAQIREAADGTGTLDIAHRGREIYIYLLRGFCFLLGNKPETAVTLQLILLVIAAVCIYFGVRKNAGVIPAFVVLLFLGFTPVMIEATCDLSVFLLVLTLYGISLNCISGIRKLRQSDHKILRVVHYILTGICIGICCFLDMSGIVLLIFLTGELCFGEGEEETTDSGPLLAFLICLIVGVVSYFVCHMIRGAFGGTFASSVNAQLGLYIPGKFQLPGGGNIESVSWDMILLAILLAVGIFAFWMDRRMRTKGIWFFAGALLFLMLGFRMGNQGYFNATAFLYLLCAVIAGINLEYLKQWICAPQVSADGQSDSGETDFDIQQIEQEKQSDVRADSQYIENPLPLPKKKQHKLMDYDYEVPEDDDFDIP